jgi:hypothetical protein
VTPRFAHDCPHCSFVGRTRFRGRDGDVYVCPQAGLPTVVFRFGDEGEEYESGIHLAGRIRVDGKLLSEHPGGLAAQDSEARANPKTDPATAPPQGGNA